MEGAETGSAGFAPGTSPKTPQRMHAERGERVSPWWYAGCAFLGITVGLVFYVLYAERNRDIARRNLKMSVWLPVVAWMPVCLAVVWAMSALD